MISNDSVLFLRKRPNLARFQAPGPSECNTSTHQKIGTEGIDDPIFAGVSMLIVSPWHVTISESWQAQPDLAILAIHSFRKDSALLEFIVMIDTFSRILPYNCSTSPVLL